MSDKIFVAGHRGMVGSAIVRRLQAQGKHELVLRTRQQLDLCDQAAVRSFFQTERPAQVYLAAARVGGILANSSYPAEFIRQNLAIQTNVIHEANEAGTRKLVFLGSSCIYPRAAPQPMKEDHLLTGPLEPTNEPYAIAKIAGIKMCQAYRRQYGLDAVSLMPTNLYGPGDNFDLQSSHVLPALMRKFHEAAATGQSEVVVWGTGTPRREFLHVEDLAAAAVFLAGAPGPEIVNVGTGEDLTIAELARKMADLVGYRGQVVFDPTKPDGTPRKLLDVTVAANLGWRAAIPLAEGLRTTYAWFHHRHTSDARATTHEA